MESLNIKEAMLRRSAGLQDCTREFIETIDALHKRGQTDVAAIWNASFHLNVVEHDLTVHLYFETTTEDVWAQKSVARTLATILYEAMEDIPHLFGKPFIDACRSLAIFEELKGPHRIQMKKYSSFSKQHKPLLAKIRNHAGAHKDHDATAFLSAVVEADATVMVNLSCEFSELLTELAHFCSVSIEAANRACRQKGIIT